MAASGMVGWGLGLKVTPQRHRLCKHDDLRCLRQLVIRNETSRRGRCPKRFTTKQIGTHSMVMRPVMQVMGATPPKPYI